MKKMKQGLVPGIVRSALWIASEYLEEQAHFGRRVRDQCRFQALRYFVSHRHFYLGIVRATDDEFSKGALVVCDEPPRGEGGAITAASIDMRDDLPPLKAAKYLVHPLGLGVHCVIDVPISDAITSAVHAMDAIREFEHRAARARHNAARAAKSAAHSPN